MDKIARWLLVWMVVCGAAHAQLLTGLGQATLPLSGNELAYVVQGGVSKQAPVNSFYSASTCSLVAGCTFTGAVTFGATGSGLAVTHNATVGGTLGVTGVATFTGQDVHNGGLSFTGGSGGQGTLTSQSNFGFLLEGHSGSVADGALQASDGTAPVRVLTGNNAQVGFLSSVSTNQTLSGSQTGTEWLNISGNLAGSSSNTGFTMSVLGSASDALAMSGANGVSMMTINDELVAGHTGSRVGLTVHLFDTAATTMSSGANLVGLGPTVEASYNWGGTATGFLTSQFGIGGLFGLTAGWHLHSGATYFNGGANEIDLDADSGAIYANEVGLQIVHNGNHAVQGSQLSVGVRIADQVSATAGYRDAVMMIGSYDSQWPCYTTATCVLQQARAGENDGTVPANAAGGTDWLQATFNGTGISGGGFAFRTQGASSSVSATAIDGVGGIKLGSSYLSATATTTTFDTGLFSFNGIASIVSGGTGYTGNGAAGSDVVGDGYGNEFYVTASGGVVTALTATPKLRAEGKTAAPAVSSLTFKSLIHTGSTQGSGLTVTENAWTQTGTTLDFGTTTATTIGIGNSGSTTTITGTIKAGSGTGQSQTCTVNQAKTLIFTNGILTGGTCNS